MLGYVLSSDIKDWTEHIFWATSKLLTPFFSLLLLITLPEDRQGLVSYSFLLSSSFFFFFLHRRMQCACVLFLLNSSTSFCQPHYLTFLQSAWTNFDETWSQWPMTKRADVQWPLTRLKVIQGQRGQKSIFSPKRIKSNRFHGMFTILIHMIAYNALYKSYGIKNSSGVIWGHRGQKVIRIQKIFKKSYLLGAI